MGLRGTTTLLGLVLVPLLLAGCGGSSSGPNTGDHYTLHVEVTSGSPLAFTGRVSPNNGVNVPISGTTPFAMEIQDREANCGEGFVRDPNCFTRVEGSVTPLTKTGDILTLCLRGNGHRDCNRAGPNGEAFAFLSF